MFVAQRSPRVVLVITTMLSVSCCIAGVLVIQGFARFPVPRTQRHPFPPQIRSGFSQVRSYCVPPCCIAVVALLRGITRLDWTQAQEIRQQR